MSGTSREHHFVPQFYLRYFSANGRRVHLFNFARQKLVCDASIKHQCSRRGFYDFSPDLERTFADMEGEAAGVIRTLTASATVPSHNSREWASLLGFVLFQKMRTAAVSKMTQTFGEAFADFTMENDPSFKGVKPGSITLNDDIGIALPLSMVGKLLPVASDLQMHLFLNDTKREFVTSDDPVVLHNQYCEGISYRGVTGWNSAGLQVFFPLSPSHLLLLFDPVIYKVGRSDGGVTSTRLLDERDVAVMNLLQILNAQHNAYFAGVRGLSKTESQCRAQSASRPQTRWTFVQTEAVEEAPGKMSALLAGFEPLLPIKLDVSKITVRPEVRQVPRDDRATMYRSEIPRTEEERAIYAKPPDAPIRYAVKNIKHK